MSEYRGLHQPEGPACVLDEIVTTSEQDLTGVDYEATEEVNRNQAMDHGVYFKGWR